MRSDVGGGSRHSLREEATSAPLDRGVGLRKVRGRRLPSAVRVGWAQRESKGRSGPTRGLEGIGSLDVKV